MSPDAQRVVSPSLAARTSPPDVEVTRAEADASGRASAEPTRGSSIGRYVLLDLVGAGGMGVVYAAYDPQLDRKVALKLVAGRAAEREAMRIRLLREAQAMARLNHPNVVTVHDAGFVDGRIYVAMEFVEGTTLSAWMDAGPHPWAEIVRVFTAAGRGLAAAHAKGLVHRDFKPDNVMLAEDGRVLVMDFGLVRESDSRDSVAAVSGPEPDAVPSTSDSALSTMITRAGAIIGTPAYMSPEQFHGRTADPRSDQFGFCVAMWEALFRQRPFAGRSASELATSVTHGKVREPPREVGVPAFVRRALERGLSIDPAERWPSMLELLAELSRQPGRRRRIAIVGAVVVAGVAATLGVRRLSHARAEQACADEAASIDEDWNEQALADLHQRLAATGSSHAEATFQRTTPWLDRWADGWRRTALDACTATRVDGERSDALLARSRECLAERRESLQRMLGAMARPDAGVVDRAVSAAASLPDVAPCLDDAWLARQPPRADDPTMADAIAGVRHDIVESNALRSVGATPEAVEVAERALLAAQKLDSRQVVAEAEHALGRAYTHAGRYDDSIAAHRRAFVAAAAAGDDALASRAASDVARAFGGRLSRPADGALWVELAGASLERAGGGDDIDRAAWHEAAGLVAVAAGDGATADREMTLALDIHRRSFGDLHPSVARSLQNAALARRVLGDREGAAQLSREALAMNEALLGEEHPAVADAISTLAAFRGEAGDYDEARALLERGLELRTRLVGPDHPDVAGLLTNLANVFDIQGDPRRGRELVERALAINIEARGERHPDVAATRVVLATLLVDLGEKDRAREEMTRAIDVWTATLGPRHPNIAKALSIRGDVQLADGDALAARASYTESIAIYEEVAGRDHPEILYPLMGRAKIDLEAGDVASARAGYERADTLANEEITPSEVLAELRRGLEAVGAATEAP